MFVDHKGHSGSGRCSTASSSAAIAALLSLRWDALTPTDLLVFDLALKRLRRHRPAELSMNDRLGGALRDTEDAAAAAAVRWFHADGRDEHHAAIERQHALRQMSELDSVSICLCDESERMLCAVLRTALGDVGLSLLCFLGDRLPGPHRHDVGPGPAALDHLVRAHSSLTLAALVLDTS